MDIDSFQRFDVDSLAVAVDVVDMVDSVADIHRLMLDNLVVGSLIADNLVELAVDRPTVVDIQIVDSLMIAIVAAALDGIDRESLQFVGDFDN